MWKRKISGIHTRPTGTLFDDRTSRRESTPWRTSRPSPTCFALFTAYSTIFDFIFGNFSIASYKPYICSRIKSLSYALFIFLFPSSHLGVSIATT
jgi:hypothetical protein